MPSRRHAPGTRKVGEVGSIELFSVRDDWHRNDLALASWLRVENAAEFQQRASLIANDDALWTWIVRAQLDLLKKRWDEALLEETIERKLNIEHLELAGVDQGVAGGGVR